VTENDFYAADERTMLVHYLNLQRQAVARKCEGLSEEQANRVLLTTSPLMTVAGIVSHLRWVEHVWFEHRALGGEDLSPPTQEDPDLDFVPDSPLPQVVADYLRQCARSDEITASRALDDRLKVARHGGYPSMRWLLLHMIEETARHAGHLDILREQFDGSTGL
jgi:uncharacterized damage-inducible protein DinB